MIRLIPFGLRPISFVSVFKEPVGLLLSFPSLVAVTIYLGLFLSFSFRSLRFPPVVSRSVSEEPHGVDGVEEIVLEVKGE